MLASDVQVFPADGGVLLSESASRALHQVTESFLTHVARHRRDEVPALDDDDVVLRVSPHDDVAAPLLEDLVVEYGTRYGLSTPHTQLTEVPVSDFEGPHGAFVVVLRGGQTIAGGAIRRYDDETAEVKRVWTHAQFRRQGLARRVLIELEKAAAGLGYRRIHLTTGPRQPEARALYLAAGYLPAFDLHADPESIGPHAFDKELPAGTVLSGASAVRADRARRVRRVARAALVPGLGCGVTDRRIVVVGAGPRALGLVERLGANAGVVGTPRERVEVHVVDPHPPGAGRIWRAAQSPLLWMNSEAQDVTVFTDESVTCEGPVVPGPSLSEWAAGPDASAAAAGLSARSFAPRVVQADYLDWAWRRVVCSLPEARHRPRPCEPGRRARRPREGGPNASPSPRAAPRGRPRRARAGVSRPGSRARTSSGSSTTRPSQGLTYVPPGHTADLDLDGPAPGEPVVVRGMGLAFVDLVVLLGEGRGGTFTGDGTQLTYHPSGREPVLHVGSRRGVPYHAKLGYEVARAVAGPAPAATPDP